MHVPIGVISAAPGQLRAGPIAELPRHCSAFCGHRWFRGHWVWTVGAGAATALAAKSKAKLKGGTLSKQNILDRELRRLGLASRRRINTLLKAGRITVNGEVQRRPQATIESDAELAADGYTLERDLPLILKYHKPLNVISSMNDPLGRKDLSAELPDLTGPWEDQSIDGPGGKIRSTVAKTLERVELATDPWIAISQYHPVGRLDQDTTGLLLLSCDGKLTERLLSPITEVPRCYLATVAGDARVPSARGGGELRLDQLLQAGVRTGEGIFSARTLDVHVLNPTVDAEGRKSEVVLEVTEGKYRMVRKMLFNCGFPVLELHRISYGRACLGEIRAGSLERPTEEEAAWAAAIADGRLRKPPQMVPSGATAVMGPEGA